MGSDETPKCEKCGAEVSPPDSGGVCLLCLRPYCAEHLAPPGEVAPLCQDCGAAAG